MSRQVQASQPQANGHPSRRENNSVSSTTSASGRSERGARYPSPAVETAVTRLLVSIKQLLEALTFWSQLKMDEEGVSNVYVRLGNDFNLAVSAFAQFNIEMTELSSVPDDLRTVLEQCLAEDATPQNLELYLPTVREIITNLLQGLRGKQSIYRRIVSDHRHKSDDPNHERTDRDSRSSRASASGRREGSHRSQGSRQLADEERSESDTRSRRSGQSGRRKGDQASQGSSSGGSEFVGGFAPTIAEHPTDQSENGSDSRRSNDYFGSQRRSDRAGPSSLAYSSSAYTTPSYETQELPPTTSRSVTPAADDAPPKRPSSPPPVPSSVKRYSLVDRPAEKPPSVEVEPTSPPLNNFSDLPPPSVKVEPSSPPYIDRNGTASPPAPDTPPIDPPPAVAKSLAALKSNDVLLERRASKRFSIYNISKMTGASTTRERSLRSTANHLNRRSAVTGNLTAGELAVLTEVDDEEVPDMEEGSSRRGKLSRSNTPDRRTSTIQPTSSIRSRTPDPTIVVKDFTATPSPQPSDPCKTTIFLQLGREVKKVVVESGLSFASLRVLFVDKFSYNPGLENFPAIYIRDPASGVQYELEDTDDVKEKCLLSLNIEPLDQIKQHIDSHISILSHDIKELRSVIANSNRPSIDIPDIAAEPLAESTPAPNRPTDRQFQHVARRLSRFIGDSSPSFMSQTPQPTMPNFPPIQSQMTGQSLQPQMTGGSVLSEYTSRVVTDLKTQFDEVQNLRRDLGIMRQLYTEFMKSTKESLSTLRTQTQSVKQLATSNVGGARAYIDSGKKKLDTRSQNVLTEVEKLQDIIESVKDDVIKRHVTPNGMYFKSIKKDMDGIATELASLSEHINAVKPMWKKTWEEELQNIVEEQQFLTHQEEFLSDLLEDYKAMMEVYGHVEKVITLRKPNGPTRVRNRTFRPPPRDEGHEGLSTVMLEIKGSVAVDPQIRLKAIEQNQKNREKDLAARTDDLQVELQDFVSQKKLKMTGGAEEAERVRQKRSEMTLKAMFNAGHTGGPSLGTLDSPTSPY